MLKTCGSCLNCSKPIEKYPGVDNTFYCKLNESLIVNRRFSCSSWQKSLIFHSEYCPICETDTYFKDWNCTICWADTIENDQL